MKNPDGDALLVMRVELGRKVAICNQDGFKKKDIMFTGNGETYLFMNLIEEGAVVDENNRNHAPLSHVSVATGAQCSNMDDITTAFFALMALEVKIRVAMEIARNTPS